MLSLAALLLVQQPRIMTFEEYHVAGRHARPYVLHLKSGKGEMIYFGVGHTHDPADRQLATLKRMFGEFRPEKALNESGTPPLASTLEETLRRSGEPGYLHWISREAGVPIASLDPDRLTEVRELLKTYSVEDLKLFFLLRQISQDRRRPAELRIKDLKEFVNRALERTAGMQEFQEGPRNYEEFEEAYRRRLGEGLPLAQVPERWFNPGVEEEYVFLNKIARTSSEYRDRYMVKLLLNELVSGRRVFAVVGASHVFMQRPALEDALGKENVTLLHG